MIKYQPMRMIIPLLVSLAVLPAMGAEMKVVVHTTDQLVVQYLCEVPGNTGMEEAPTVHVVKRPGRLQWHVVNGVAPYVVVRESSDDVGNVCVTVVDAVGNSATGCGFIGVKRTTEFVRCNGGYQDDVNGNAFLKRASARRANEAAWKSSPTSTSREKNWGRKHVERGNGTISGDGTPRTPPPDPGRAPGSRGPVNTPPASVPRRAIQGR